MNGALLSSKKMDYCTPKEFFAELDKEFHFALDAAATEASAKCAAFASIAVSRCERSGGNGSATM